jgi:hypothetical protein
MRSLHKPQINYHLKTGMEICHHPTGNIQHIGKSFLLLRICQNLYAVQMLVKKHSEISFHHDHQIRYTYKMNRQ